jgi:ankyrin repeat protein
MPPLPQWLQATEMSSELHYCADYGDLEMVTELVEAGANVEETDSVAMTALSLACLKGHFAIVVCLVEHGANVNHTDNDGMTTLHCASMHGDLSSVK